VTAAARSYAPLSTVTLSGVCAFTSRLHSIIPNATGHGTSLYDLCCARRCSLGPSLPSRMLHTRCTTGVVRRQCPLLMENTRASPSGPRPSSYLCAPMKPSHKACRDSETDPSLLDRTAIQSAGKYNHHLTGSFNRNGDRRPTLSFKRQVSRAPSASTPVYCIYQCVTVDSVFFCRYGNHERLLVNVKFACEKHSPAGCSTIFQLPS
jgi:hypothetical protein